MMSCKNTSWQYAEFQQVGTDYADTAEVARYDSRHSDFRDLEVEALRVLDAIEIRNTDVLIDFGSGTGTLAILAARRCRRVHAVDVSGAMIEHAGAKAAGQGVANIEFHQAGFLTYEHNGPPVDGIVTTFALHHLPDFWKGIALKRLGAMLTPGGRLYMHDVILEEPDAIENIAAFIDMLAKKGGASMKKDVERHFKDEFSTYDWVMDGLLGRAGFTIRSKNIDGGVLGTYLCVKN
jgi:cyclopropane fatty-acyl-phospholipid synthase-like methyltransferase